MITLQPIDRFVGFYDFLSNFHPSVLQYNGLTFTTVEHAYQAMKSTDRGYRTHVSHLVSPGEAKKAGRTVQLRADWEDIKYDVMMHFVRMKFTLHYDLRTRLIQTAPRPLVEGNHWGDTYWGVCNGVGQNKLGLILQDVRNIFMIASTFEAPGPY